ncbi:hypothetical protein CAEBREN_30233 [Caenorhabditis brenneri]|uniref:Uncharacterized protein n=1 Tax=Caenorhabditis brenneri TaxID=135651 RepID=G0MSM8_CAEBE|nr:hypothetical protein CAEBREN_30233 [Caenorhabditis brenneri]
MDSVQISNILSNDRFAKKTFIGVYSADELQRLKPLKKRFGLIVNTDESNQPGRHWQSIFVDESSTCHFFCSLDETPTPLIYEFMQRYKRIVSNRNRHQKLDEVTCGGYCIFIQAMMARGYQFTTLCDIFEQIENDDVFVRSYLKDTYNF